MLPAPPGTSARAIALRPHPALPHTPSLFRTRDRCMQSPPITLPSNRKIASSNDAIAGHARAVSLPRNSSPQKKKNHSQSRTRCLHAPLDASTPPNAPSPARPVLPSLPDPTSRTSSARSRAPLALCDPLFPYPAFIDESNPCPDHVSISACRFHGPS